MTGKHVVLRTLDSDELAGVLAHALRPYPQPADALIHDRCGRPWLEPFSCWPTWRSGAPFFAGRRDEEDSGGGMLSLLFMAILAPIAATLIQLAVPDRANFLRTVRFGHGRISASALARALEKLHGPGRLPMDPNPATAHLFIVNPLTGVP